MTIIYDESAATSRKSAAPDFTGIKKRQQARGPAATSWHRHDAADRRRVALRGHDLRAGELVLDVAAGNGNATLAAARRFATVTSTDYVPEL